MEITINENTIMSPTELIEHTHVYSMFSFRDGKREPGLIVNKYNLHESKVEYYFIPHKDMNEYKKAFERYDTQTCNKLATKISADDVVRIESVSLSDYMKLMEVAEAELTNVQYYSKFQ
jgi:hypothetical protein